MAAFDSALQSNELYCQGGLFDEFMQLQPAQLSWGGMMSVLSSLVQSHGQALMKIQNLEDAVLGLKSSIDGKVASTVEIPTERSDAGEMLIDVFQMNKTDLSETLKQAASEPPSCHARAKYLHSLPAFHTIIADLMDALDPVTGTSAASQPVEPASHNIQPSMTINQTIPLNSLHANRGKPMVGLEIIDAVPGSTDPLSSSGVRVFSVRPDGPAASAGVQNGDCIVALNGRHVSRRADLKDVMSACCPNDVVRVDLLREGIGEPFQVNILLGCVPGTGGSPPRGSTGATTPAGR